MRGYAALQPVCECLFCSLGGLLSQLSSSNGQQVDIPTGTAGETFLAQQCNSQPCGEIDHGNSVLKT